MRAWRSSGAGPRTPRSVQKAAIASRSAAAASGSVAKA
jgi:hypothetical protein